MDPITKKYLRNNFREQVILSWWSFGFSLIQWIAINIVVWSYAISDLKELWK